MTLSLLYTRRRERMTTQVRACKLSRTSHITLVLLVDSFISGFETSLLETTLEKISSLLQVGFGVAGAQIIQSNMSSGGDLNVMIPGKKVS